MGVTIQDKLQAHVGFLVLRLIELEHSVETLTAELETLRPPVVNEPLEGDMTFGAKPADGE